MAVCVCVCVWSCSLGPLCRWGLCSSVCWSLSNQSKTCHALSPCLCLWQKWTKSSATSVFCTCDLNSLEQSQSNAVYEILFALFSFSKLLEQKEQLEQKHLHLLQILDTERQSKWQYVQQTEELATEVRKLKSEVCLNTLDISFTDCVITACT